MEAETTQTNLDNFYLYIDQGQYIRQDNSILKLIRSV